MRAGAPEGMTASKTERDEFSDLFAPSEFDGSLEAAFLLKQTGIALAAWSRTPVPEEVISVMAATMWGSLDTMIRTLGGEPPRSVLLEIEDRRILAMPVEPNWTLLLVAARSIGKRRLRHEARRILERASRLREQAAPRHPTIEIRD